MDENDENTLHLSPTTRQEQILAPQLRESLRVLQMDWQTLVGEIHHEAEVNPVVDIEEPESTSVISTAEHAESRQEAEEAMSSEDDSNPSVNFDEDAAERRQRFFDRQVAMESLQEHLLAQIGTAGFSEEDREIAELIVGDINDDGRYIGSLDELNSILNVGADRLTSVLKRVQEFDPPGVGGRNLRECLEIQVRQLEVEPAMRVLLLKLIEGQLSAIARKTTAHLPKTLGVNREKCLAALKVLRSLEPKPGRPFLPNGRHPQYLTPELEVSANEDGLTLTSRESDLPTVKINAFYQNMLENEDTAQPTRLYLRNQIDSAERLQEAIHRRGETIMRVAETIFTEQREFFEHGFGALRPLTIEEVARQTGYHGTTVGRAVNGKYVRTPHGVFELRRFFCVGHLSEGDAAVSATAVKCRLTDLIKQEGERALTDDDMARALSQTGLTISRRTIAKYRDELGIPTASERRKRRKYA